MLLGCCRCLAALPPLDLGNPAGFDYPLVLKVSQLVWTLVEAVVMVWLLQWCWLTWMTAAARVAAVFGLTGIAVQVGGTAASWLWVMAYLLLHHQLMLLLLNLLWAIVSLMQRTPASELHLADVFAASVRRRPLLTRAVSVEVALVQDCLSAPCCKTITNGILCDSAGDAVDAFAVAVSFSDVLL